MKVIKTAKYKKLAQNVDGYFKGDAYRLTGGKKDIHGGSFLEAELLEGPRSGTIIVIPASKHPNFMNKQPALDFNTQSEQNAVDAERYTEQHFDDKYDPYYSK